MADSSFDVVSKIDRQEVDNAVNQAVKEVGQRYDFFGCYDYVRNTVIADYGTNLALGDESVSAPQALATGMLASAASVSVSAGGA